MPWEPLRSLVATHDPTAVPKGSRPPIPLDVMQRAYFLKKWHPLSDPMAEEAISNSEYDSEPTRRFSRMELWIDRIPDQTTILNFLQLLERHGLTEAVFGDTSAHLAEKGIIFGSSTMVDTPMIDASVFKEEIGRCARSRKSSTKKGDDWYLCLKAHFCVHVDSGLVRDRDNMTAKVLSIHFRDALLSGEETSVWVGKGCVSAELQAAVTDQRESCCVMHKAPKDGPLHLLDERFDRPLAKVEHTFGITKSQFSLLKTRYRGLSKNRTHLFTLFALANLFLEGGTLTASERGCLKLTKEQSGQHIKHQNNHWVPELL